MPKQGNAKLEIISLLGGDPHCRGKVPLLVKIERGNKSLQVVYKPRDGETDIAILELFKEINDLLPSEKSMDEDLPVFKCFKLKREGFVSQFVRGVHLSINAYQHLRNMPEGDGKDEAGRKLKRLEWICCNIGLADLHRDNVLYNEQTREWIPIDLEVVQLSERVETFTTSLATESDLIIPEEKVQCTQRESELINDFNQRQFHRVARAVPITISEIREISSLYFGYRKFTKILINKKVIHETNKSEIEERARRDFNNGDYPYLTYTLGRVHLE